MSDSLLMGIFTTILGVLLTMIVTYVTDKLFGTREYKDRKMASSKMIKDMTKSVEMNFVGITHEKAVDYLKCAIQKQSKGKGTLNWEKICFFYPSSDYGVCWDDEYNKKMNLSILKISNFLLNDAKENLPNLKHVYFYMNSSGINFGGSLFRYKNSKHSINIIYDVYQARTKDKEQDNQKTIRLNYHYLGHKVFFERLLISFEEMKNDARIIYRIDCNEIDLWNMSTVMWDNYEQKSDSPHVESMQHLLNQINIQTAENILSLGVGTGKMENLLLTTKRYKGFLGLVDKSYSMLYSSYYKLKDFGNTAFALLDLSKDWILYGELAEKKYDYILIHFSIHHFIGSHQSISDFAHKLKQLLEYNGKIVIAIHDNIYSHPDNNDVLRKLILEFAKKNNIPEKKDGRYISVNELKLNFYNSGLFVVNEIEKVISRNIDERIAMWEVDAILDSLIEVSYLSSEQKSSLYKEMNKLNKVNTKPMTVKYIQFSDIIKVASAIILNDKNELLTVVKNGYYLLPGGEMLYNEDEEETIKRELMEELTIDPSGLRIMEKIGKFNFEKAYIEDTPLQMNVYKCELDQKSILSLKPDNEISRFEWIDLNKFNTYDNMPKEYFLKILNEAQITLE